MIVAISEVQLKKRIDPLGSIEGINLLRVLSNTLQNLVSSFALLVPQGEIYAVWLTLWFVRKDVLLHSRKPERVGDAAYTGKQVRLVDGIQRKQPRQRIPHDPTLGWHTINLLLCRWDDFFGQKPQIVVRITSAGLSIFESRWAVLGNHIVVPV